ncbi:MAG: lysylphosphatidylglycerol synthase domain-containing protein, partial [Candidatus Poribacteria bacterium]|nr:lysylphosphatidylglycerol synthase domain-containing protein [Candidatus Poribacteria bacterium]
GLFSMCLVMLSPWIGLASILAVSGLWLLISIGLHVINTSKWGSRKSWLVERLRVLRQLPRRLVALNASLACVCFGLMTLQFYLLLSSLQPVGWQVGLTLPIILVVSGLPISIMGFGLREGTAVLLLSRYGVPMESAVAAAFSLFVVNSLLPGLIGIALSPTLAAKKPCEGLKPSQG